MSIYEEEDLLKFAKKSLERNEKSFSGKNEWYSLLFIHAAIYILKFITQYLA